MRSVLLRLPEIVNLPIRESGRKYNDQSPAPKGLHGSWSYRGHRHYGHAARLWTLGPIFLWLPVKSMTSGRASDNTKNDPELESILHIPNSTQDIKYGIRYCLISHALGNILVPKKSHPTKRHVFKLQPSETASLHPPLHHNS